LKLSCSISQLHVVPIIGWVTIIGSVTLCLIKCDQSTDVKLAQRLKNQVSVLNMR